MNNNFNNGFNQFPPNNGSRLECCFKVKKNNN